MVKRLILYDIDGTLLHSHGAGRIATRAAMQAVYGMVDGLDQHNFGGKTDWQTLYDLLSPYGITHETIRDRMPDYEIALAEHMQHLFDTTHTSTPCPGAMKVVEQLDQDADYLQGIVTGNCASSAPVKLKSAEFDLDWFPIGAYGSEAQDRNDLPPLALKRAIAYSGVEIQAQNVVVIGDTVADIDCGRALGAKVIAVSTGYVERDVLAAARPDILLDDLTTLLDVL